MKLSDDRVIIGISVCAEFLEYCIGRDPCTVLNSAEFFPRIIKEARESDADPEFVVEAAGGFETGIIHALQRARLRVSVAESTDIQKHCGLADPGDVDARAVARYAAAMWEKLGPAPRVERVLTAFAGRRIKRVSVWKKMGGWLRGLKR
jgi:hypothetical protein